MSGDLFGCGVQPSKRIRRLEPDSTSFPLDALRLLLLDEWHSKARNFAKSQYTVDVTESRFKHPQPHVARDCQHAASDLSALTRIFAAINLYHIVDACLVQVRSLLVTQYINHPTAPCLQISECLNQTEIHYDI